MTTYTVLILEKNSVQIKDLVPGTAYLFRVQALSSDGSPGGSSMEEQFETSGTDEDQHGERSTCFCLKNEASLIRVCVFLSRTPHAKQHGSDLWRSRRRSGHVVHCDRGAVPAQTVSIRPPLCCSPCLSVLLISRSFTGFLSHSFAFSFVGPPNGLCIQSLLTSLFLSSFSQLSLSLYLDLCPGAHWGRICVECALSLLNG